MLEIISQTLNDSIQSQIGGADRIELVCALIDGGLTPSIGLIKEVTNAVSIPVRVMLRPHGHSFVYDAYDQQVIMQDLQAIRQTNAEGIVFGALTKEGLIDTVLLEQIIQHKGSLKLTFHRAVDASLDYNQAMQTLLSYPIDSILTSGGLTLATDATAVFQHWGPRCAEQGIELLAGKGITASSLPQFIEQSGIHDVHFGTGAMTNYKVDASKVASIKKILRGQR